MNSDGTFFVVEQHGQALFHVDATGSSLRRVGRAGDGPGEFHAARFIGEAAGSGPATGHFSLHIASPGGELKKSFRDVRALSDTSYHSPILALSGDTAFWVASSTRYRFEKWSRTGELLAIYDRGVDWYPPRPTEPEAGTSLTTTRSIHEDGAGRLWVFMVRMPVREFTVTVRDRSGALREEVRVVPDPAPETTEAIVEVLDPPQGVVLASSRTMGFRVSPIQGSPSHFRYRESDAGLPLYDVWTYRAELPATSGR